MKKLFFLLSLCINLHVFSTDIKDYKLVRNDSTLYLFENGRSFVVNQEIITLKPKEDLEDMMKGFNVVRSNILGFYDVLVPQGIKIEDYYIQLKMTGAFESIDLNTYGSFNFTSNDPGYSYQWHLDKIHANEAWDITCGAPSIKIAVLDSGIDTNHPDLGYGNDGYSNLSFSLGNNSTPSNYHGTFVAGIIGAKTNNSTGISGISGGNNQQGVIIIPYCVGSTSPDASIIDDAIIAAVTEGANIIQLSLSVNSSTAINQALSYAYNNGVTIICASGNNSTSSISYPASNSNVIAVGATSSNDYRASFSNYGTGLDLVAPGDSIYSTTLNNSYNYSSGTSFAAPQVSAVASLLLSIKPNLQPDNIRSILRNSATKISTYTFDNNGWNQEVGYGLLNAFQAVMSCIDIIGSPMLCLSNTYSLGFVPSGCTVSWSLSGSEASNFTVQNNTPSSNQCTITRKTNAIFNSSYFTVNLSASIIKNGTTIYIKTKELECNSGFICTFKEPAFSYNGVNYPAIPETPLTNCYATYVYPMGQVTLTSGFFHNKTITTSGPYNSFQTLGIDKIKFSLVPMSYSTDPLIITVWDQNCDPTVTMYFYPMASPMGYSYSLHINQVGEQSYEIRLESEADESLQMNETSALSTAQDNKSNIVMLSAEPSSWQIELYNSVNGRKTLRHEVKDELKYTLNTQGLHSGVYVIKVFVGDKTLTDKIVVK